MQFINSLARKIFTLPINCFVSYIPTLKAINSITLKPDDLDRLCMPDFYDVHIKSVVSCQQRIIEKQKDAQIGELKAYIDGYQQIIGMQNLAIAEVEHKLQIAINIINGYKRLSAVEYPIKYGFFEFPEIQKIEYVDFTPIVYDFGGITVSEHYGEYTIVEDTEDPVDYDFGGVKVSYCGGNYTFEDDNTFIEVDTSIENCKCEKPPKVKDTLPEFDVPAIIPTTETNTESSTDDDTSEDTVSDCEMPQPEPEKPKDNKPIKVNPDDDSSFHWSEVDEKPIESKPVYVVGLEFKTLEEKEKLAKTNNTTVESLHPIMEKPNICKFHMSCDENRMADLIRDNINSMSAFEDYVENLTKGKTHYPSDMSVILTYVYIELSKHNDFMRSNSPRNITTIHYVDNVYNKVYKHYTARIAFTFDIKGWENYYVKLEIVTKDGKKHDSSNNVSDSFKFYAYKYKSLDD